MNKKILRNLIVSSLAVGVINFSPIILHENNLQIVSVAYAAVENVTASDSAILDFGEENPQFIETVKNIAKMRAVQAAKEKAGVYVKSFSKTVSGRLTDNDISAYTSNNIKILDVQYKKIPVQTHDVRGNDTGKIAFMYEATVTAKVDTSDLQNYIRRDEKEKYTIVQQNNDSKKNVEKISNDFENLRKTAENKTSEQIKAEVEKIDNEVLAQQKFDEGFKLCKNDRKFNEAIPIFNEALKLNPNNSDAYRELGWAYTKLKDYDKALFYRQKALELNPNDLYALGGIGDIYIARKEYEKAISFFNESIKIHPEFAPFYSSRAEIYRCLKNYTKAMSDYDKAIQLNPNLAWIYRARGWTHCDLKNFSKAILDFKKAIELEPHRIESYNALGWIYNNLGEHDKALTILNKAVQINQNNPDTFEKIAEVYSSLKQYKKAISYCDKSIKINHNDKNYFWAYVTRGFCYQALGENKKAEADFAKARQLGWKG